MVNYDQALVLEDFTFPLQFEQYQAPDQFGRFPPASANGPVEAPPSIYSYTVADGLVVDTTNYYFPPLNNSVLVKGIKEVPHNFQTPPHPNASNNPPLSRDAPQCRQSNNANSSTNSSPPKDELKRLSHYVTEEVRKIKVSVIVRIDESTRDKKHIP